MKGMKPSYFFTVVACTVLLTACAHGPYPGVPDFVPESAAKRTNPNKVAPPQVVYRIDENRYFELVPRGEGACTDATVFYADTKKGIRSLVVKWDRGAMGGSTFIIDAANDEYLVGPVTRGNTDCSSGGGYCSGSKLPYSVDGGKTWKLASPGAYGGYRVFMSGKNVYTSGMSAKVSQFAAGPGVWRDGLLSDFPKPIQPSLDTQFSCIENGRE